jgi:tetratricopeptide (TPR) repeat protein
VVVSDAGDKQALRVASQFEQMRAVFHTLFPNASDGYSPIVVVAVKDKKGMLALEPEAYLAKNQLNIAGLFMHAEDRNYILARLDVEGEHPYEVVYHEYTHFMLSKATWVPLWLDEGLASFYENTDIHEKEVLLGQPNMNELLYLKQNRFIPLATLFGVDRNSPYYHDEQKGSVFYAESWALTYYLEMTDYQNKTNRLQQYASLVSQGKDPVEAAQQAFGDLKKLQDTLEMFIRSGQLRMFQMNSGAAADTSKFEQKAITQAEADAIRGDVLVRTRRTKDAEALLDETLKAAPENATAHEAMGLLKFHEGDIQGARKWYGEAVRLDSQDCLAHYYFAVMSLQAGDHDNDAAIESSLQTSIKLNPAFAPAYDALAMFYMSRDMKLNEAHLLNVHAVALEPERLGYRMNAASVLSQQRQYAGAIGVLQAARKVAKTPDETALIDKRLEQLKEIQAAVEKSKAQGDAGGISAASAGEQSIPGKTMVFRKVDGKVIGKMEDTPNYPAGDATGPSHNVKGVLRDVRCAYPTVLALTLDDGGQKVSLYSNNYYKVTFTTANYEPEGEIKPCSEIEGMKASIEYKEVNDKAVAGQILSIELSK